MLLEVFFKNNNYFFFTFYDYFPKLVGSVFYRCYSSEASGSVDVSSEALALASPSACDDGDDDEEEVVSDQLCNNHNMSHQVSCRKSTQCKNCT